MPAPFVEPIDASSADAIAAIRDDFELLEEWEERFRHIVDLGQKLPTFPEDWMNDSHKVPGCLAQVWMEASVRDGKMFFAGKSDAAMVSGLVALLLRVYSGRTPSEILDTDPNFMVELGLDKNLTANRGNGVRAMTGRIRGAAQAFVEAG